MKKDFATFRVDITFWLAILLLLATMLSRHVGKLLPVNLNVASGGSIISERGDLINPDN